METGWNSCTSSERTGREMTLPMCRIAELSVGIIEAEGAYGRLIANVDICTRSIEEALDVLAMPKGW